MKKIILLVISTIFLYSCGVREVMAPIPITMTIIENKEYISTIPVTFKVVPLYVRNITYKGELPPTIYAFTNQSSNIRKSPKKGSPRIAVTVRHEKMEILEVVKNGGLIQKSRVWYKVKANGRIGYIHSSVAVKREFNFKKMAVRARNLDVFIKNAVDQNKKLARIIAYEPGSKEKEGLKKDKYGSRGEQSIVGNFPGANGEINFRYLQDGRIVSIEKEDGEKLIVKIPESQIEYTIEKKSVRYLNFKEGIKKIIIIDLKNQVEAVFLKPNEVWELIGYNLITSGRNNDKHAYDTPKGDFIVQNTLTFIVFSYKEKVLKEDAIEREEKAKKAYEKSEKNRVEEELKVQKERDKPQEQLGFFGMMVSSIGGETPTKNNIVQPKKIVEAQKYTIKYAVEDYEEVTKYSRANYGIRFSGGGYLHGIPLKDESVEKLGSEEKVIARKKISELNLGTFRASHKCVRNVDEFESFLYHEFIGYKNDDERWRLSKDNISVIVF